MPTPGRTSLAQIIAAGREILDTTGPASVTMQAVATRVGVRAPSLYKHVRDRDALLSAVTESVLDDLTANLDTADTDLTDIARAYRGFAQQHPDAFRLLFSAAAPHAALQRSAAPVIRASAALVGDDDALDAARLFTAWATGFLQMELSGAFRLGGDVDRAFDYGLRRLIAGLTA